MAILNEEKNQWKPGESGNKSGRPKGALNRATILRKWLELPCSIDSPLTSQTTGTVEDRIALALINKGLKGDVAAIKEILDSAYGKVKSEEIQPEVWTVIKPKPISDRD
jgi:hypothetical protein